MSMTEQEQDGGHATTGTIYYVTVKGIRVLNNQEISSDSSYRIIIGRGK